MHYRSLVSKWARGMTNARFAAGAPVGHGSNFRPPGYSAMPGVGNRVTTETWSTGGKSCDRRVGRSWLARRSNGGGGGFGGKKPTTFNTPGFWDGKTLAPTGGALS